MNGRERVQEFIREQERYATGCKTERYRKRYWDMAADIQLLLDVCNAAHDVVNAHTIVTVIPAEDYDRLIKALDKLDREAMRDQGMW